jgi:YesN/AraC family two-component response regulator
MTTPWCVRAFAPFWKKMTGIEVVVEAGDGREALELAKKQLPNVMLMDIAKHP